MKDIRSILDELKSNMVQKSDIAAMQRNVQAEAPYE